MSGGQHQMYAVAIRDDQGQLLLFLRIHRSPFGAAFVCWPRDQAAGWDPHVSLHESGELHHKSFDVETEVSQGARPNESFRDSLMLVGTGISSREPGAFQHALKAPQFTGVFEIPLGNLRPEKYRTWVHVHLVAPDAPLDALAGAFPDARIVQQAVFQHVKPWLVMTLTEYPDWAVPSA